MVTGSEVGIRQVAVTGNKRLNHIHHLHSEYKGKKLRRHACTYMAGKGRWDAASMMLWTCHWQSRSSRADKGNK